MKACIVTTSPLTVRRFLLGHLAALSLPYDVTLIVNAKTKNELGVVPSRVKVELVAIHRGMFTLQDLHSVMRLYRIFRAEHFTVVHAVTAKAGLLAMTASALARVPVRIQSFTGQAWACRVGAMRWLLKAADRWTATLATRVLVDSTSQKRVLAGERIVREEKCTVLGSGSLAGVDLHRCYPETKVRVATRERVRIPDSSVVFLYLGRLKRDKGVLDLAEAFNRLSSVCKDAYLLVVGPDEESLSGRMLDICGPCSARVRVLGYTTEPETYLVAADVICLPSYREGFGSVIIEAAACGIPAIGTRIPGLIDAIEEGETGLLHQPKDIDGLTSCMISMLGSLQMRREMGERARGRATKQFSQVSVTAALVRYYESVTAGIQEAVRL